MKRILIVSVILSFVAMGRAEDAPATRGATEATTEPATLPTTQPATEPTTEPTTEPAEVVPLQPDSEMYRMLHTSTVAQPLLPEPAPPPVDATSGMAAVKPKAPVILLRIEGYYVIGRMARLGKTEEGFRELVFDSDGQAMRDPPMRILPNQMLELMEAYNTISPDPMAFRISGLITMYKFRNYILIDKAVPLPRK